MATPIESWHPLKRWRRRARLTQEQVAARIGVAKSSISRWEKRERIPEPQYWPAIVEITGGEVTPNDFMPERSPSAGVSPAGARGMHPGAGDGSKPGVARQAPSSRSRADPAGGEAPPPPGPGPGG